MTLYLNIIHVIDPNADKIIIKILITSIVKSIPFFSMIDLLGVTSSSVSFSYFMPMSIKTLMISDKIYKK